MANTVIIYRSKCGSTEQYAEWIREELGADLLTPQTPLTEAVFSKYDNFVFGMPIYEGLLYGGEIIADHFPLLKGKNIFLFVAGMTELDSYTRKAALISTFPQRIRKELRVYQLRGNYKFRKLSVKGRMAAYALHNRLQTKLKKNVISDDEEELLYCLREKQKWLDKETIFPLTEAVRNPQPLKNESQESDDGLFILDQKGELKR